MVTERRERQATPDVVLAVWTAEDGRCEACRRPMDKRWAKVARIDESKGRTVDNLQLLCVDCKAYRPDPLASVRLVLGGEVATRVLGQLTPEQLALAGRWLGGQLKQHGVLVWVGKYERRYWLPGVASFQLRFQEDGTAVVERAERVTARPEVKIKPQERTRGLPRPDRISLKVVSQPK